MKFLRPWTGADEGLWRFGRGGGGDSATPSHHSIPAAEIEDGTGKSPGPRQSPRGGRLLIGDREDVYLMA